MWGLDLSSDKEKVKKSRVFIMGAGRSMYSVYGFPVRPDGERGIVYQTVTPTDKRSIHNIVI